MRFRYIFAVLALAGTSATSGCAVLFPPTIRAIEVEALPSVDGLVEEVWQVAPPVELQLAHNVEAERELPMRVRALHDGNAVAFLVEWPDATPSETYRHYRWDEAASAHVVEGMPDDQFALKINMTGSIRSCMLAGNTYRDDVWQWRAARTNAAGYAQDRLFEVRLLDEAAPAGPNQHRARNGKRVELAWIEDEGPPLIEYLDLDESKQSDQPLFGKLTPGGSQADVRARGRWSDGWWSLELSRVIDTGHADDAPLDLEGVTKIAVAVFDQSEGEDHFNSRLVKLRFR